MAYKGQWAKFAGEGKGMTVTTFGLPKVAGDTKITGSYRPIKKSWMNYCPYCKRWGSLHAVQRDGSRDFSELTLVCGTADGGTHAKGINKKGCDADFSCVSGWETSGYKKFKLRPATVTPNSVSTVAASQTQSQKCSLSKAEALTKAKEGLKDKSTYKGTLKIPLLQNIRAGDLIGLELPGFDKGTYYIDSIKEDIDNQTYELALLEGANHLTTKYGDSYLIKDSKGNILNTDSTNPLQAKCSNVNINIGLKDDTAIGKKIRLKGQELGTVDKIYRWLRVKAGGGVGGWKYVKYTDHYIKSEKVDLFGPKSAEKCWKAKKANCADFAWIMSMLGKGAGKKIGVRKGTYTNPGDKTQSGHMWNYCGVKNYDCSSASKKSIEWMDIEEVK